MLHSAQRVVTGLGVALFAAILLAGCNDTEKIVFRDREVFNPPPDETHGFLGYYDAELQLTSCGNCHAGTQREWEGTAHAGAYETLEMSGSAQPFCYGCHTVSENGNPLSEAGGWNVVQDAAYHDVQCESCHGAGLAHVQDPGAFQPIPSLAVPENLDNGCAECHSGAHHPFAEEWMLSGHASVVGFAADRESCAPCHRGQGVLEAWGVDAEYLERSSSEHLPITCGVCHDPHSRKYAGQLRFPVDTNSPELHLCARCHNRRTNPDAGSSHGLEPHAPETDLLFGDAGWFPPDSEIEQGRIIASHGSEGNAKLCATCHVNRFTVNDAATGDFVFQATGHLFTAIPCVDSEGIPQPGDCGYNEIERSFVGCATSGCHSTAQAAASALTITRLDVMDRAADLMSQLVQVDAGLDDAMGEIDPTDPTFTVAEGCFFNYNLAYHGGDVTGSTTHNPFLTKGLLLASITAMEDTYGVFPTTGSNLDYREELRELLARASR